MSVWARALVGLVTAILLSPSVANPTPEPDSVHISERSPVETPKVKRRSGEYAAIVEVLGGDTLIANAVEAVSEESGVPAKLIVGIIRTENPWLKPDTVNAYGAIGLMQVVGWLHLGDFPECGDDLTDIETNLCYGVRIFQRKLEIAKGDTTLALLFYNGCWGETYIEGCERYPNIVEERRSF